MSRLDISIREKLMSNRMPATVGKLKVGEKRLNKNGKEYPVSLDYFVAKSKFEKYENTYNEVIGEKVNNLKEVGTLYPEYFVTLFPYDKGVDLHQTLSDVFIANENYLKTSKMVFAFESFDFFSPELMEMVIMELWNDSMLCKEILFYLKK
jgi:hypothetical protein